MSIECSGGIQLAGSAMLPEVMIWPVLSCFIKQCLLGTLISEALPSLMAIETLN